jgi:trigger factor
MVVGETKMIPGFEEQIIGMKKAENKEFDIDFPKDFPDKEFAGQKAKFEVTLKDLREIILPELNEGFFQKFGLKSIKELKENIRKSLEAEKQEQVRGEQVAEISEQLVKTTKVDIPKSLIENEKARMKNILVTDLQQKGLTLDQYVESLKITDKKFDEDLSDQAQKNILLGVTVGEIARTEKIEVNSQDGTRKVFDYLIDIATKN